VHYRTYKTTHCWRYVDAHAKNGAGTVLLSLLQINAANRSGMHKNNQVTAELPYLQDHKSLTLCDASFNVLSIQHLLPSTIVFILIWLYRLSFYLIVTRPCGKAEQHINLALFTLTQLKIMYHAKRFIAPAIHLFMNRYSHATSYHLPIIYL